MDFSHNDISNELRNIFGSSMKLRTSSTPYRPNNAYLLSRKIMKQPKRSTFELLQPNKKFQQGRYIST